MPPKRRLPPKHKLPAKRMSRAEQHDALVKLQQQRNWLYNGEIGLVESFVKQCKDRDLSVNQTALLLELSAPFHN
jgi:hypothetical protein